MEVINSFIGKLFGRNLQYSEQWATDLVSFDSGREQRNQLWEQPIRHWTLTYDVLAAAPRDLLIQLFRRAKGRYTVFLFEDPNDYECGLTECSITAVAAQVNFQLIKTYYGGTAQTWNENKTRIQPSTEYVPIVKVDGVAKAEGADFTLNDSTGVVTFGAAPGAAKVITADYRFYYPVRFDLDVYDEATLAQDLWSMGGISLAEVLE